MSTSKTWWWLSYSGIYQFCLSDLNFHLVYAILYASSSFFTFFLHNSFWTNDWIIRKKSRNVLLCMQKYFSIFTMHLHVVQCTVLLWEFYLFIHLFVCQTRATALWLTEWNNHLLIYQHLRKEEPPWFCDSNSGCCRWSYCTWNIGLNWPIPSKKADFDMLRA